MSPTPRNRRATPRNLAALALATLVLAACGACGKGKPTAKPLPAIPAPTSLGESQDPENMRYPPEVIAKMSYDDKFGAVHRIKTKAKIFADQKDVNQSDKFYANADMLYDALLKDCEKMPAKDRRRCDTLNEVAYYYYSERFQFDKALEKFIELAKQREVAEGPDSPELALDLNKLGNVYSFLKKDAEAEPEFKRALEILARQPGAVHPYRAIVANDYGAFLRKLKRDEEADKLAQ